MMIFVIMPKNISLDSFQSIFETFKSILQKNIDFASEKLHLVNLYNSLKE